MAESDASRAKRIAAVRRWNEKNPFRKGYWDHKSRARMRGIPFLMTFEEWRNIWIESGKFNQRGHYPDNYCMARNGDVGPYAMGNVRICTRRENNAEQAAYLRGKPVNDKQKEALSMGRIVRRNAKWGSDRQRAALAKALEARWARKRINHST